MNRWPPFDTDPGSLADLVLAGELILAAPNSQAEVNDGLVDPASALSLEFVEAQWEENSLSHEDGAQDHMNDTATGEIPTGLERYELNNNSEHLDNMGNIWNSYEAVAGSWSGAQASTADQGSLQNMDQSLEQSVEPDLFQKPGHLTNGMAATPQLDLDVPGHFG